MILFRFSAIFLFSSASSAICISSSAFNELKTDNHLKLFAFFSVFAYYCIYKIQNQHFFYKSELVKNNRFTEHSQPSRITKPFHKFQ